MTSTWCAHCGGYVNHDPSDMHHRELDVRGVEPANKAPAGSLTMLPPQQRPARFTLVLECIWKISEVILRHVVLERISR